MDQPSDEPRYAFSSDPTYQPRPKQYYALQDYQESGLGSWKEGDIVLIPEEFGFPLVRASILMPLYQATKNGNFNVSDSSQTIVIDTSSPKTNTKSPTKPSEPLKKDPKSTDKTAELKPSTQPSTLVSKLSEATKKHKSKKKSFLGNELKDKIEENKDPDTQSENLWDKLQ